MKEKILLIGGSSKVGESIIKIINKTKYNIFSTYNKKKLKFKGIYQVKLDLESKSDRDKFSDKYKDMNVIIFLSGVLKGKKLSEFSDKEIYENLSLNFTDQILLLKKILAKQKRNCLLVFISSISGRRGSYDPIYASAKGAMISFIKSISKWESPKIKSIGLCPGLISNTKMYKTFDNERLKKLKKQNPNKEFVNSNDLAKIIIDVIKPHWKHANGSIIDVNGGVF